MEQALWNFIFGLVSAAIGSVAGSTIAFFKQRKHNKTLLNATEEARLKRLERSQMLLMRSDLIRLHDCFMQRGYCPTAVKYSIKEEYDGYHALGGNGVATKMVEDVMALPEKEIYFREGKNEG